MLYKCSICIALVKHYLSIDIAFRNTGSYFGVDIMSRTSMINVRLKNETHTEFKALSEIRGASMSTLLHQFILTSIREEKERDLKGFQLKLQEVQDDAAQKREETPQSKNDIKNDYGFIDDSNVKEMPNKKGVPVGEITLTKTKSKKRA